MQVQDGASREPPALGRFGFLSYGHHDRAAAEELRERLRGAGLDSFRDDASIRGGERWFERLEDALARSAWFIVLVGRTGIDRWVGAETQVALARHFSEPDGAMRQPIVPLLLPGTDIDILPPFLSLFQAVRWAPGEPLPEALLSTLRASAPCLTSNALPRDECPYRGLSAFREQDSHLFYGRSAETLHAISLLGDKSANPANPDGPAIQASGRDYRRWLQVEGHSGAGKSSLVQAGMLPLIQSGALWSRTGISAWRVLGPMQPGADPVTNLAEVLQRALREALGDEARFDLLDLRERLLGAESAALALLLRQHRPHDSGRWLLVIDQFEELITLAEPRSRQAFDVQLARALADPECPLFVISTLRTDFLDRLQRLPNLYEVFAVHCERYLLPTIGAQGLREAIELPGRLAGVDTSEVASQILADARDEPGALPLVENALTMLWHEARPDGQGCRRLSGERYEALGRLVGLLSRGADALLDGIERALPGRGRRGALELLLALTRVNPDGRHTRQRLRYEEAVRAADQGRLSPAGRLVLDLLAGTRAPDRASDQAAPVVRLVTIEALGKRDGAAADDQVVDLIHETLIRARGSAPSQQPYWPTLYHYVQAHRDRPLHRQHLAYLAERWQRAPWVLRWRHLSPLGAWGAMRRVPVAPQSPEGRYVRASRRASVAAALLVTMPLATLALSASLAWSNDLPWAYTLTQLKWYAGIRPIPEVVSFPPGRFTMGCVPGRDDVRFGSCTRPFPNEPPMPASDVTLERPCEIGRFEVTFEQFDYFVWSTDQRFLNYPYDQSWGRGKRPVINVSWSDAQRYLKWLSDQTGQPWRLPTEVEWEYAARGGNHETTFWWGNDVGIGHARCNGCESVPPERRTSRVGSYACNGFGICDTAGNVAEWVHDDGSSNMPPTRMLRGGSWRMDPRWARAAARDELGVGTRVPDVGFRVCRGPIIEKADTSRP